MIKFFKRVFNMSSATKNTEQLEANRFELTDQERDVLLDHADNNEWLVRQAIIRYGRKILEFEDLIKFIEGVKNTKEYKEAIESVRSELNFSETGKMSLRTHIDRSRYVY